MKQLVGSLIRKQRKVVGLTADELGRRAGVNRTYISKIENGTMLPSRHTALTFKKVLGLGNEFMKAYYEAKYPDIIAFLKTELSELKRLRKKLPK